MQGQRILQLFFYIFLINVNCESKENANSKKFIPYFRRQVEEVEDKILPETTETDDPRSNLVSFLVKNVREIFDDIVERTETRPTKGYNIKIPTKTIAITSSLTDRSTTMLLRATISTTVSATEACNTSTSSIPPTCTDVVNENLTLTTLLDEKNAMTGPYGTNTRHTQLTKNKKTITKTHKKDRNMHGLAQTTSNPNFVGNSSDLYMEHDPRRSCIMCNNVAIEDCNDPKNKLIQSVMCERDDDLCYSMHTPFGIIDRGCFNSNHNLTTYVCSCNLCNYISISEMPYTFSNKRDWVDNVIEISRTRHFRKSIFKDMSCLRCEVNATLQKGDMLESANCLEGSIGNIPVEECEQNEVCGVKAIRADGYIWRGCVNAPLYNYWWQLCDYDLCNYDTVLSLYDFV